jgi:predicted nucleotidyltransferase
MTIFEQLEANKFPYTNSLIHLFRGGSDLHGAQLVNKHDDDWYGVYVEPPSMVIGLKDYPHYVWSTAGDTKRNVPGDMDICLYSLRKWSRLASGGNPTCLSYLFANNTLSVTDPWQEVRNMRVLFLSKACAEQFRGFALAQRQRYMGERGQGKHGQRPELINEHGFDTKAAMHVMRLLGEGIELMQTGEITYPRPNRDILIAVREGKYDMEFLKDMTDHLFHDLDVAQAEADLPDQVDREAVSRFLTKFYLNFWGYADTNGAMNRVLARAVSLACRWIAGHLRADPRADGHPAWEEWRDEDNVKKAMLDMAVRGEE